MTLRNVDWPINFVHAWAPTTSTKTSDKRSLSIKTFLYISGFKLGGKPGSLEKNPRIKARTNKKPYARIQTGFQCRFNEISQIIFNKYIFLELHKNHYINMEINIDEMIPIRGKYQ